MRLVLITLALLVSGCTANEACQSLIVGTNVGGAKKREITAQSDSVFRAMLSPATSAPFGRGTSLVWDHGPAEEAMCCATQQAGKALSWCTAEQLACTDPSMQGLKLYILDSPYSDESRAPDDATYCFVALHEGRMIAVWHRFWS